MSDTPAPVDAPTTDDAPHGGSMQQPLGPERLKALSHPLRLRILDLLQQHRSLTASGLAELVGESSGSTSYHLRQLERHRFVREVEGKGTARERWWETAPGGYSISSDPTDDLGTRAAKSLVNGELERSRQAKIWRVLDVMEQGSDTDPRYTTWKDATTLRTMALWATPEQLAGVVADLQEFLDARTEALRGQEGVAGAAPVQIHFNAFPVFEDDPAH